MTPGTSLSGDDLLDTFLGIVLGDSSRRAALVPVVGGRVVRASGGHDRSVAHDHVGQFELGRGLH